MIAHLKSLLRKFDEKNTETDSIDFKTGLAALLVEVMRADGHTDKQELDSIEQTLITYCDLDITATSQLLDKAKQLVEQAIDLYSFVNVVNANTNDVERIEIIEFLWQVAYADGSLDGQEDHIIRKISGLMYVTHADFIQAKINVQESRIQ
ncbi:tellurite resistance TerB family protein [Pseudoalteromonas piratica]|uniref:Co-chaperone DjlA N-terminal domain-containing protein n=1 Tax=Pseudoalteromonas piratica TaxID=1348114 RepID=A0A0A7ELQ5_9GAMM|nr:TerB family tellurite resistance protein [Pseudoalteromonas piratica]AIY67001.1 hypothetical protein OM33_18135 [Pseudoalteromonas piratica]